MKRWKRVNVFLLCPIVFVVLLGCKVACGVFPPLLQSLGRTSSLRLSSHGVVGVESGNTILLENHAFSAEDHALLHKAAVDSTLKAVTVPLHNVRNRQYIGKLALGSDHQELHVIFDTG